MLEGGDHDGDLEVVRTVLSDRYWDLRRSIESEGEQQTG